MHKIDESIDDVLSGFLHDAVVTDLRVTKLGREVEIDFDLFQWTSVPNRAGIRLRFAGVHSCGFERLALGEDQTSAGTMGVVAVPHSEAAHDLQATSDPRTPLIHYHIQNLAHRPGALLREDYRSGIHIICESCEAFYI